MNESVHSTASQGTHESTPGRPVGTIVLIATACFLIACAGKLLQTPTVRSSPLWPVCGLLLVILIKNGTRAWPGVWIGSSIFLLFGTTLAPLPALFGASAATLQALLGARLVRPLCEAPEPLTRERDILRFLLLGGPLACLLAPTATTLQLLASGTLATPLETVSAWLSLWAHDAFGVLLFAPLAMLAWPGNPQPWPGSGSRLALTLITTVVLLASGHIFLDRLETSRKQELAEIYNNDIYRTGLLPLEVSSELLNSAMRALTAASTIGQEEFSRFTTFAANRPEILRINWAPRVPESALADFVAAARAGGAPDFEVSEFDADYRVVPARVHADHFPVLYSTAPDAARVILGFDPGAEASRRRIMDTAIEQGRPGVLVVPRSRSTNQPALLVFRPIFPPGFAPQTATEAARRSALRGFLVTLYDVDRMLTPLAQAAANHGFAVRVTDVTPGSTIGTVFDTLPAGSQIAWHRDVALSNGLMRVEMGAATPGGTPVRDSSLLVYHLLGVLAGLLLSFAALASAGRETATRAEVRARTAELARLQREAEQASQAKSTFLSTMSHEIRTPMNGLLGTLELLEHSGLSERQRDHAQTMRTSASTLLALINDILDFSKIEADRIELETAPLSIAELVESLCASKLNTARTRGVALHTFIDPDLPAAVLGDDTRLRQVLYNLISNALKFSSGNPARRGQVSVRVTAVSREPLRIAFSIRDNGIGMDTATQTRLFTPFVQGEASTTRRFGGTGLGLTICQRLVSLMSGTIEVSSTPGEGSTFTVTIPFTPALDQPADEQPDLSGLVCVVLEGPDLDTEALGSYLSHAGATVQRCSNGAELLHHASTPGVLISSESDCQRGMPAMQLKRVCIGSGRRRHARVNAASGCVSIDADVLRRQAFLHAVAIAAGRASAESAHEGNVDAPVDTPTPVPPSVAQARAENRLILIAEDDSVNQKVILQQLALLGHAAEVAGDGARALALWRNGGFGILFTDLNMPVMDGYRLTTEIRRQEEAGQRLPIIALTANALRDETERTRKAGMDACLTKPVTLARLREVLEAWMPSGTGGASVTTGTRAVDVSVLQGLAGNDPEVTRTLLADYALSAGEAALGLRAANASGDHAQIAAIAHRLKSSSRSVGALALGDLCAELENTCRRNDRQAVVSCMARFEALFAMIERDLTRLLSKTDKKT